MKIIFLKQKLQEYQNNKSLLSRLYRDSKYVKALEAISKSPGRSDLTPQELEPMITILLSDARGAEGLLYEDLRENLGSFFLLMQSLSQHNLFNSGNLSRVYYKAQNSTPVDDIWKSWNLLASELKTYDNFDLILQNAHLLPFSPARIKIDSEHELDLFFSESLLNNYKKNLGDSIVGNLSFDLNSSKAKQQLIDGVFLKLPKNLQTEANFRQLFTLPVIDELAYSVAGIFSIITISTNNTETQVITPNNNLVMQDALNKILDICLFKNYLDKIYACMYRLPGQLATVTNFNLLTDINNVGIVSNFFASSVRIPQELKTKANFDRLINNAANFQNLETATRDRISALLSRLPEFLFTQNIFDSVLEVIQAPAAERQAQLNRLEAAIDQVTPRVAVDNQRAFNPAQSTHTTSVHKSVSESAVKLKKRYISMINSDKKLNAVVAKFTAWGGNITLESLNKHVNDEKDAPKELITELMLVSAKKAIEWLSDPTRAFVDPGSQVSTRELFAFIWLGVHDNEARIGSVEDAYRKVIIALYDIQRGYNLNDKFEEKEPTAVDRSICTAGTFNKLMEILWGIHQDVELRYITSEKASLKILKLVPNVVNLYLKDLISTDNNLERAKAINVELSPVAANFYLMNIEKYADKKIALQIISIVLNKGINPIWETIKPVVAEQMFDEYGSLYKQGKTDTHFVELINNGIHVNLDKDFISKLLPGENIDEKQATDSANSASPPTARIPSFFRETMNFTDNEEKPQENSKSLSDWQNNFKQILKGKIDAVENNDKALCIQLKILNRLLEQYPLDRGVGNVELFERNLTNTMSSIKNSGDMQELSSHYSESLKILEKSSVDIAGFKQDMESEDSVNSLPENEQKSLKK